MSAMSASSPPAGLRGLSLITEHKSSVPPSVQPLPRTPEKMAVSQQPPAPNLLAQPQQPAQVPLPSQSTPPAVEPVKQGLPVAVANGMELTQPPVSFPSTEVPPHQTSAMETTPTLLPPPPAHLPNLPCGSKGEQDRTNDVPPTSNQENNGGEMSESAEAPASDFSQQPPASAATVASPNHQSAVSGPTPKELPNPVQASPEKPSSPKQPVILPQAEPQETVFNSSQLVSSSKEPAGSLSERSVDPPEPPKEISPISSTDSTEKPAEASECAKKPIPSHQDSKSSEVEPKTEVDAPAPVVEEPKAEPAPKPTAQTRAKRQPKPPAGKKKKPESVEEPPAPSDDKSDADEDDKDKPKRKRRPTEPYQSWNSERTLIAQISKTIEKVSKSQPQNEKLIVFYRNEFLAVRSVEGGFYICQAMQNIYRTSQRIKIRWLSQEANSQNYTPDFYDHTEFDCILTNLNLERIGKDKFRLPEVESQRTQSILKRAMDVESGVAAPSDGATLTEEHPDGLDLSLYRNEDQLKKRKKGKRKGTKKKIVAEVSSVKRAALARVIKKRGVGASSSSAGDRSKTAAGIDKKPATAPSRASSRRGAALAKRKAFAEAASKRAAAGISAPPQSSRRSGTAVSTGATTAQSAKSSTTTTGTTKTSAAALAAKRKAPSSSAQTAVPAEKRARLAGKTRSGMGAASTANVASGGGAVKASNASTTSNAASASSTTANGASAGAGAATASTTVAAGSGSTAGASNVTRRALRNAK